MIELLDDDNDKESSILLYDVRRSRSSSRSAQNQSNLIVTEPDEESSQQVNNDHAPKRRNVGVFSSGFNPASQSSCIVPFQGRDLLTPTPSHEQRVSNQGSRRSLGQDATITVVNGATISYDSMTMVRNLLTYIIQLLN
jgi:hypothetical protein